MSGTYQRESAASKAVETESKLAVEAKSIVNRLESPSEALDGVGEEPAAVKEKEDDKSEPITLQSEEEEKVEHIKKMEELEGDVVAEFTQQLSISNLFIYNARNEDVTLVVENLGYGDIYMSDKSDVHVGREDQRLMFKEQRAIKTSKLFFTSVSHPIVSIMEIK